GDAQALWHRGITARPDGSGTVRPRRQRHDGVGGPSRRRVALPRLALISCRRPIGIRGVPCERVTPAIAVGHAMGYMARMGLTVSMAVIKRLACTVLFVMAAACLVMPSPVACGAEQQTLEIASKTGVHVFAVELAVTDEERARGLMYRRSVPEAYGMLFDFK